MAANMQHMGGPGMMPQQPLQQQRSAAQSQLSSYLVQAVRTCPPPPNGITWHNSLQINERVNRMMQLGTQIILMQSSNVDVQKVAQYVAEFERDVYQKATSKEAWEQQVTNKIETVFKKRQANEGNLQNQLNSAQQHQQAQAMMGMQNQQMGRGMGQQGFQQMQRPMQMPNMTPQQQQQFRPQQPQQQQYQQQQQMQAQQQQQMAAMAMGNQAGRGMNMTPQQMMAMQNGQQNRPQQQQPAGGGNEMSRLAPGDRNKVYELAQRLMNSATEEQRNHAKQTLRQKLTAQQVQEFQNTGRDPLVMYYQQQAFNMLKSNAARQQQAPQQQATQGQQNQNPMQAQMMQQQQSQQSFQQRQNMMNGGQQPPQQQQPQQQPQPPQQQAQGQGANDFSQFTTSNMESIKDQQMNGLMAQQAGQMVVPASNTQNRAAGSQPMAQSMSNQNQNQRFSQQGQQQQAQKPPQQQQQGQGVNMQQQQQQQMKMNQQQQAQLQAQTQMQKQMQGQQAGMGGMGPQQSPAMGTLNTPASQPGAGMNQTGPHGAQANAAFRAQQFNQQGMGMQRANQLAQHPMFNNMTPEQRQRFNDMSPAQLTDAVKQWQQSRQGNMGMNGAAQHNANQMGNQQQGQAGQMNPNMGMQAAQGMQRMGQPGPNGQQRPGPQGQQQMMMDSMDVPPRILQQLPGVPPEVKKWRELKMWAGQNGNIPQQTKNQLADNQSKQFQMLVQQRQRFQQQAQQQQQAQGQGQAPGPNMNMTGAVTGPGGQVQTTQQHQALEAIFNAQAPAHAHQVNAAEIAQVRNNRPQFAQVPDAQMKDIVLGMKKNAWITQYNQRKQQQQQAQQSQQAQMAQMQGQPQPQGPQGAYNAAAMNQAAQMQQPAQMQPTPTPQGRIPAAPAGQKAQPQAAGQKPAVNRGKKGQNQATPSPAQGGKNLKRPSGDMSGEAAAANDGPQRKGSQANQKNAQQQQQQPPQQLQGGLPALTAEDLNNMTQERRAKYEQMRQANGGQGPNQVAGQAATQSPVQNNAQAAENLNRLRYIGAEEQKQFAQDAHLMTDINMPPDEFANTKSKLERIVVDMGKIGRGLSKWYSITRDDARARMFFRMRLRIIRQFTDGEGLKEPRNIFSIRPVELDQARTILESMARDLAESFQKRGLMQKTGAQGQGQAAGDQTDAAAQSQEQIAQQQRLMAQKAAEQAQQQQSGTAPLNAANLEKNSQAHKKAGGKGANNNQPPAAPTRAQPPYSLQAPSPHGQPNYIGKPKDMNLKIPARKRAKLDKQGQGSQAATPSPKTTTKPSPALQDAQYPAEPVKPALLCQDAECKNSIVGYVDEESLQQHVQEEHIKPKEDPLKFFTENLLLALDLDADGSVKKESMSRTASKQAALPGHMGVNTPSEGSDAMKKSFSAQSNAAGVKASDSTDAWSNAAFDGPSLLAKLGFPNGISSVALDPTSIRSVSPKDTPESAKDSGSSEPNTDIADANVPEFDFSWHTLDSDVLLNMDHGGFPASFDAFADGTTDAADPSVLMKGSMGSPNWDDVKIDFDGAMSFDTSQYYMGQV